MIMYVMRCSELVHLSVVVCVSVVVVVNTLVDSFEKLGHPEWIDWLG